MKYWHYRAYDENLNIVEGVLVGPDANDDTTLQSILLRLRQQRLQGVSLTPATQVQHHSDEQLRRLRTRLVNSSQTIPIKRHRSIRERVKLIVRAIFSRRNIQKPN